MQTLTRPSQTEADKHCTCHQTVMSSIMSLGACLTETPGAQKQVIVLQRFSLCLAPPPIKPLRMQWVHSP